jgi:hypothetical protein
MHRIALPFALLLALVAPPAAAFDLGRLLPIPGFSLPSWLTPDPPAPAESGSPRVETTAAQPTGPANRPEGPAVTNDAAAPAPKPSRPRGWRGLLPGSLK